jgi:hypothetical protein
VDADADATQPEASIILVTADAAPDASEVYPAPHPAAPEEVNAGGAVLAHPKIVPITYDGDPYRAQIEAFIAKIGASGFWSTVTAEYGVGPATTGRPVHLAETAPAVFDDVDVKAWLTTKLDGTHPEFDPPDDETMYIVYFPQGTTYTLFGSTGCKDFGASDNVLTLPSGRAVPYIAMPRCPAVDGLDVWNTISALSSHELYEEATDPFKSAVVTVDPDHMAWSLIPRSRRSATCASPIRHSTSSRRTSAPRSNAGGRTRRPRRARTRACPRPRASCTSTPRPS